MPEAVAPRKAPQAEITNPDKAVCKGPMRSESRPKPAPAKAAIRLNRERIRPA